jgi:hypothetical protein
MPRLSFSLIAVAITMGSVSAAAQDGSVSPAVLSPPQGVSVAAWGQTRGGVAKTGPSTPSVGTISLEAVELGKPVLDAPYSAEAVTTVTQILADGNRIEQRTVAVVARDRRGRTRREQHGIALGALVAQGDSPIVTIADPSTGTHVNLNQDQKVALRSHAIGQSSNPSPSSPTFSSGVGGDVLTGTTGTAEPVESSPEVRTRKLGTKEIEGIRAEGTQTTMTIRAGAMGNRLPIKVISERWYSPELKTVLLTRRVDPRFGETEFRLTNIVRGEPPSHLFEVPSDFRIEDPKPSSSPRIRQDER